MLLKRYLDKKNKSLQKNIEIVNKNMVKKNSLIVEL